MFIREYFLAKSLVSFSSGLIFSSRPTSSSVGWLIIVVLGLSLSRHPGVAARPLCSPLAGRPFGLTFAHMEPVLCASVLFTPPSSTGRSSVCLSHSPAERPHLLYMFSGLVSSLPDAGGGGVHWRASSFSGLKLAKPGEAS